MNYKNYDIRNKFRTYPVIFSYSGVRSGMGRVTELSLVARHGIAKILDPESDYCVVIGSCIHSRYYSRKLLCNLSHSCDSWMRLMFVEIVAYCQEHFSWRNWCYIWHSVGSDLLIFEKSKIWMTWKNILLILMQIKK